MKKNYVRRGGVRNFSCHPPYPFKWNSPYKESMASAMVASSIQKLLLVNIYYCQSLYYVQVFKLLINITPGRVTFINSLFVI